MNPISGTYRYPPAGPTLPERDGLPRRPQGDRRALHGRRRGAEDDGPDLRPRRPGGRPVPEGDGPARAHRVLHRGPTAAATSRDILRETMFAPTVTGSPLESACRVISRYEPQGRGYYSGVVALIGRDARGDADPRLRDPHPHRRHRPRPAGCGIGVGATLVRALRPGVGGRRDPGQGGRPARARCSGPAPGPLRRASRRPAPRWTRRNATIAGFWLDGTPTGPRPRRPGAGRPPRAGRRRRGHLHRDARPPAARAGPDGDGPPLRRAVRRSTATTSSCWGPGPGDPRDSRPPQDRAPAARPSDACSPSDRPFLAVCLSHQVLSTRLGLDLRPPGRAQPGRAAGDRPVRPPASGSASTTPSPPVGTEDQVDVAGVGAVEVSRDPGPARCTRCAGRRSPPCSSTPSPCSPSTARASSARW